MFRNKKEVKTKKRVYRFKEYIQVILPCKTKTQIDYEDEWILNIFPSWVRTKNHVTVSRAVKTEYGTAWEAYYLHRIIVKPPPNMTVDHKDRNSFNNRRSNLRLATASQNSANSISKKRSNSGFRGVCRHKRKLSKQFIAYINRANGRRNLGYHHKAEDAARAYDVEAKKTWGEFAILNFPNE